MWCTSYVMEELIPQRGRPTTNFLVHLLNKSFSETVCSSFPDSRASSMPLDHSNRFSTLDCLVFFVSRPRVSFLKRIFEHAFSFVFKLIQCVYLLLCLSWRSCPHRPQRHFSLPPCILSGPFLFSSPSFSPCYPYSPFIRNFLSHSLNLVTHM